MTTKNNFLIIAGALNLLTFILHLIGGQVELVNPMMDTDLGLDKSTQLLGAWHIVTIILLATSYVLLSAGFGKQFSENGQIIRFTMYLNFFFCIPFILGSFYYGHFVPQWILFLPIALLTYKGVKKMNVSK